MRFGFRIEGTKKEAPLGASFGILGGDIA